MFFSRIFLTDKIILAPRGQLSQGAMVTRKKIKMIYLTLLKPLIKKLVYKYHATTISEKNEIIKNLAVADSKINILSNLRFLKIISNKKINKKKGKLNIVFYSRIVPKKNLLLLLKWLARLNNDNISLDIYGTVEDKVYFEKCMYEIKNNNLNNSVKYLGFLNSDEVQKKLSVYDFFILPTKNENFGHVIIEALYSLVPLILSDKTPFTKDIKLYKIGHLISLQDFNKFRSLIYNLIRMDNYEYLSYSNKISYFISKFEKKNKLLSKDYLKLFN